MRRDLNGFLLASSLVCDLIDNKHMDTSKLDECSFFKEKAQAVYRAMITARLLEGKISSLYKAGKIVGGVYLGKGQEAVSASLGALLRKGEDVYAPLIRDQAGRLAFGESILDCTRTYLGSIKGPMRGRDGNVHRGRPKDGLLAMISHLGASLAVVCGMLFAQRMDGKLAGHVGVACVGDGCTSTGAFHEGLNLAAVERLPLVLTIANNQYAYSTPNTRQFACKDLLDRVNGYGVAGWKVDGTDMFSCIKTMEKAVGAARKGEGPQVVVANFLRLSGHGEHDDAFYVDTKLQESELGNDCILQASGQMLVSGFASKEELDQWEQEARHSIEQAVSLSQHEPPPNPYEEDWRALYSFSSSTHA